MGLAHFSNVYGITDCKIAPVTADTSGGTTYGSLVDVPGVKSMEISGTVTSKRNRGDNKLLAVRSLIESMQAMVPYAQLSLDVLAAIAGGSTTDTGTTPNQKSTYSQLGANTPKYFKLEAKTDAMDFITGDGHILLYKCVITAFPTFGFAEEDFAGYQLQAESMPRGDDKQFDIVFNETAAAIA